MKVRPVSEKHKLRDLCRSRQYKVLNERYGDWVWDANFSHIRWYPKKACRTEGNRAVRRYKEPLPNGCAYKKVYDVMWEVW